MQCSRFPLQHGQYDGGDDIVDQGAKTLHQFFDLVLLPAINQAGQSISMIGFEVDAVALAVLEP